jgi:C-terminal processing protease CtpA/Prc
MTIMKAQAPDYLGDTHKAVRGVMKASTDLPAFLATAGTLSLVQRRRIVDQALVLLEQNYAHLPLKEAMHAANPVQALRLLKDRLAEATTKSMGGEFEFHAEMLRIFVSVRDLHTNYVLPKPFAGRVAFVPFDIEQYIEGGQPRYLVSHIVVGFNHATFEKGVEVRAWNGIPINRAVEVIADRHGGSNRAARLARGVQLLTQRPLMRHLPPDGAWVEVDYVTEGGDEHSLRFDWRVFDLSGAGGGVDVDSPSTAAGSMGVDDEVGALTTAKRLLFAPDAEAAGKRKVKVTVRAAAAGADVPTTMSGVFRARSVTTSSGEIGHLRIFTFSVDDPEAFVAEARRLVSLLPQDRLVIDVRGNGGGHIWASEGLLQLFTPHPINPEPTQFIATSLNRRICRRHRNNPVGINLKPWLESLTLAVRTGAVFSTGHPITPTEFANVIGQTYRGRVACITDALCYSATDIFAAGFQDHGIGPVVGVDNNTGAGGANVWTHELLRQLMRMPDADPHSPYEKLPQGVGMRVSIRRTLRVGDRSGTPLEDLGVQPDELVALTHDDLIDSNRDLLDRAASILDADPLRRLEATAGGSSGGSTTIELDTDEIGRVDIYLGVDRRPFGSISVRQGPNQIDVPDDATTVRFEGFSGDDLVISNTLDLGG